MFSFSNLNQDQQNTPFFQDHEQKPSIFNSQFSDQISAFDLFNSNQNNSTSMRSIGNIQAQKSSQQYFPKHKQNTRNSKKSIILELDQFDRKEAFKDLENVYNSQNSQITNFLKPVQYNRMAESRVKKFEFNQFEKQSQSNAQILQVEDTKKSKQTKLSFNMQLNFVKNNSLSNQQKLKQSNITQNNLNKINNPPKLQKINISDRFGKLLNKKSPSIQQTIAKNPQRQVSQSKQSKHQTIQRNSLIQNQPQKVYFNDQQFSFNLKIPKKQQSKSIHISKQEIGNVQNGIQIKNNYQKDIQKQDFSKSMTSTNQSNNNRLMRKNGQVAEKSTIFNPISFQNLVKQQINLKSSRVLMEPKNIQTIKTDQKTLQIDIKSSSANLKSSQSNKFSLNSFSNLLKKSLVRENQIEKNNNSQPQKKITNFNNKEILTNKQVKSTSLNLQNKFSMQNKANKPNILTKQPEKANLISIKMPKADTDLNSTNTNKNQITIKNQQSNLNFSTIPQKLNKPKEKPCFNLKIIKQPSKNENKNQKQKKSQLSNVLIKQQINKRQDITTVKLLKNTSVFEKGLTFKNFDNKQKQTNKQKLQEKQGLTPKIIKIESKSSKLFTTRQTQKLKQQKTIALQIIDNPQVSKTQPINYQLYQNQLNKFEDEIQQTKRKYLNNQNNYRQIFLLLNKANMILNQKSFSQTQGTNTDTKIAKI